MAKGVVFEIQGLPGFRAALERAVDEVRANVGKAMEETAEAIAESARAKVPVDKGDLRNAILVKGSKLNWRVGISDVQVSSRGGASSHQHPWVYGKFIEFGTKDQPARPFMRPAADAEAARFEQRIRAAGLVG